MINAARNTTHFIGAEYTDFLPPICWVEAARNRHLWSGGYVTLHVLFHRDAYLACTQINIRTISTVVECDFQLEIEEIGSMKIVNRTAVIFDPSRIVLLRNGACERRFTSRDNKSLLWMIRLITLHWIFLHDFSMQLIITDIFPSDSFIIIRIRL